MLLEICVEDAAGLLAAIEGGADRIELCASLGVGGLTPPPSLMQMAAGLPIPVRALCRPQPGGFDYGQAGLALVAADVEAALRYGLDGVVIGAGNSAGLDTRGLARIVDHARAVAAEMGRTDRLGLTLHRVFDTISDMPEALETAIALGFDTVLTSGGRPRAQDAIDVLAALVEQAAGRITVLAGSGIDAAAIAPLAAVGLRAFHASCRRPVSTSAPEESALRTLGFVPAQSLRTDAQCVRNLREAIARYGR